MFQKLQEKWKVSGTAFVLIFLTFAIGGSMCGIIGKKIMGFTGIDKGLLWLMVYIIILTIIWPICVLIISIPFGQFSFFQKYIRKIFSRFAGKKAVATATPKVIEGIERFSNIAIFASGAGSNAARIIQYYKNNKKIRVALIACNKPGAGVLQIAAANGIPVLMIERKRFSEGDAYVEELRKLDIQWIVLAGFLWKIPSALISAWRSRIINIHPALLPKYGGKGMYGKFVHEAVIAAGDQQSGISIHYVDEIYDHGEVIRQERCDIDSNETADSLAEKIHLLEHKYFPGVIEEEIERNS
jgi:formyltetrahydrofolate-dependent phosphoribosylglycinamide formyltransferase